MPIEEEEEEEDIKLKRKQLKYRAVSK